MITRRGFAKSLLTLPIFLKGALGQNTSADWDRKMLAVRALRMLNTAQAWHFARHNTFLLRTDLAKSDEIAELSRLDDT
jgi:hypothetical protein